MRKAPTFEDITSKQVMNKVTAASMPFRWSLNPYRGCTHGCSFCYARSTHTYMGLASDDTFRQHVFVKSSAAAVLEAQLTRQLRKHDGNYDKLANDIGLIAIGTATDPYQPIEARRRITRECLEVLARFQVPISITTRSPLILRDLDILQHMQVRSINISVNTLDKTVWRNLEPATPAPMKRLEAVQAMAVAGLTAGVFLAPIIPYLTDSVEQLHEVVTAATAHKTSFIMPSVMRLTPEVKAWFLQTIDLHYPQLSDKYQQLYRFAYPPFAYVNPLMNTVRMLMRKYCVSSHASHHSSKDGDGSVAARRPWETSAIIKPSGDSQAGEQMVLPI